jgi:predicted nucleic acid-binding protein
MAGVFCRWSQRGVFQHTHSRSYVVAGSDDEVFKRVLQQRGETEALRAAAFMQAGEVLDLSSSIAMHAARISADLKMPMADSIMLASAREFDATLWTQDSDFEGLKDVSYIRAQ